MFQVKVSAAVLHAASLFLADPEENPTNPAYAHAIIDRTVVATDGRTMFVANPAEVVITGANPRPFLLPFRAILGLSEERGPVTFMVTESAVMDEQGQIHAIPPGNIVEWRRVYPEQTSGELANFNLVYLDRCVRANVLLGSPADRAGVTKIHHNGDSTTLIELHDRRGHAVIMPMRSDRFNQPYEAFTV